MVAVAIASRSAFGAPAILAITGHPVVSSIVVSRDLGDAAGRAPALRGVPCLVLDFVSEAAVAEALARLRTITDRFTHKETATRVACSNEVPYTLRLVRGFDEATIAAIDAHREEALARYAAAQRDTAHHGTGRLLR